MHFEVESAKSNAERIFFKRYFTSNSEDLAPTIHDSKKQGPRLSEPEDNLS